MYGSEKVNWNFTVLKILGAGSRTLVNLLRSKVVLCF